MCCVQCWVLLGPSASCSFSNVGHQLGELSPGYRLHRILALKLSPELLRGPLKSAERLWFESQMVAFITDWQSCLLERSARGDSVILLGQT